MDHHRFDDVARTLSSTPSRRTALSLIFGGAVVSLVGGDAVDAKRKKKKKKKKCAKAGQKTSRKRKKCCPGLAKDGNGICAAPGCTSCAGCPAGQLCAGGACLTLEAAITAAAPGDTLSLCAGTYAGNVSIYNNLTLIGVGDGADPAANTILQGTGGRPVMIIANDVTVTLQHLRVTGGVDPSGNAGGIDNRGSLTMTDCTVSGNTIPGPTGDGGGISNSGTLTLTNCAISENTADRGAGIAHAFGTAQLTNCTVSGNTAVSLGGGVVNEAGTLTLNNSTVTGNHVTGGNTDGGGIWNNGGVVQLTDSTVSGNTCTRLGGGIFTETEAGEPSPGLTLVRSVVEANTAGLDGGGIQLHGGVVTLDAASSVTGNHAGSDGGGIYIDLGGTVSCGVAGAVSNNTGGNPSQANNCVAASGSCGTCNP